MCFIMQSDLTNLILHSALTDHSWWASAQLASGQCNSPGEIRRRPFSESCGRTRCSIAAPRREG